MDEQTLVDIGLSMNEAKVYLAFLELGASSISNIAKKCRIHRTNVYDAVHRLQEKGLMSEIKINDKRLHEASEPEKLINFYKEKEFKLLELIPHLNLNQQLVKSHNMAAIYEGVAANRRLLEGFLKFDDDITSYGLPKDNTTISGLWWINSFHKRRIAKKQKMLHIYNENAKERIKYLNSLPYTEAKYLPPEYNSPVSTEICGDEVLITSWKGPVVSILIKNKSIAKTFRNYFGILYKTARI